MFIGINKEHKKKKKSIWEGMQHMNLEMCIGIDCDVCPEFYITDSLFNQADNFLSTLHGIATKWFP